MKGSTSIKVRQTSVEKMRVIASNFRGMGMADVLEALLAGWETLTPVQQDQALRPSKAEREEAKVA